MDEFGKWVETSGIHWSDPKLAEAAWNHQQVKLNDFQEQIYGLKGLNIINEEILQNQAKELEALRKAIKDCLNYANGRQTEWGSRAEHAFEFLDNALLKGE